MQYLTPSRLRQLLTTHGIRPERGLGQNFLVDANIVRIITAQAAPTGLAVDIGAGPGVLTLPLSHLYEQVLGIEIDERFESVLREVLAGRGNVQMVFADAREMDWAEAPGSDVEASVFGNLPYGSAAPIMSNFLGSGRPWATAVFMLQREVAERLTARPGGRDYGILTLAVAYYAEAKIVHRVSPRSFYPPPDVESAVVRLLPVDPPPVRFDDYIRVVRGAFGTRRKTIRNSLALSGELDLDVQAVRDLLRMSGVDPGCRGESLGVDEYVNLARNYRRLLAGAT
ncbi:MAG: 16S rRNA (adenine(1518)-N(6)/adenine(1519)-N(6))-dimethyltransferase RsmA [Bacillota bacterium]